MDCILEPDQYNLIFRASFLSLGSSVYAIHNGHYDLALCPGGVFLTSITYWVKPDYSWRRYLDYKKKLYWKSTYSHCMLHLIANIANIVLYSGRIA